MTPNDPKHPWARLTAAARQVNDPRDTSAPYGFATRIAARAFEPPAALGVGALFERFSLRAVGVAGLLALLSIAVNYPALAGAFSGNSSAESEFIPSEDAIALLVDLDFSTD
jgi:hypothetical protein